MASNPVNARRARVPAAAVSLLVVLLLGGTLPAAWATATPAPADAEPWDAAGYTVKPYSCDGQRGLGGLLYLPRDPLTHPPAVVVALPALAHSAHAAGPARYAHAFASAGISVLTLPSPGSTGGPFLAHTHGRAAAACVAALAARGEVDGGRVAFWGAEWGAAAALEAALAAPDDSVQAVLLQTPWLAATSAGLWRRTLARGPAAAAAHLFVSALDAAAAALGLPPIWSLPLAGPAESGALVELGGAELEALRASIQDSPAGDAASTEAQPFPRARAATLLELLTAGRRFESLLPHLGSHAAHYGAAGDKDGPGPSDYSAASRASRFASFKGVPVGRYALLAAGLPAAGQGRSAGLQAPSGAAAAETTDSEAAAAAEKAVAAAGATAAAQAAAAARTSFEAVVTEQTLLLAALLGPPGVLEELGFDEEGAVKGAGAEGVDQSAASTASDAAAVASGDATAASSGSCQAAGADKATAAAAAAGDAVCANPAAGTQRNTAAAAGSERAPPAVGFAYLEAQQARVQGVLRSMA